MILEPPKIKSLTVSLSICHEGIGPGAMILVYQMLSYKPTFSLSSFTFIKRLRQGLYVNLEGWDGERDGREFQNRGDIGIPMADSF